MPCIYRLIAGKIASVMSPRTCVARKCAHHHRPIDLSRVKCNGRFVKATERGRKVNADFSVRLPVRYADDVMRVDFVIAPAIGANGQCAYHLWYQAPA